MDDKNTETVKNWLEPKLIRNIQIFLGFTNFYSRFIQGFSKIAGLLILMLKTSSYQSAENLSLLSHLVEDAKLDGGGNCNKTVKKLLSKKSNGVLGYLTPNARQAFSKLRQAFTKAPILWHFDPAYYIRIKIDALSYTIDKVLNQLILDNIEQ